MNASCSITKCAIVKWRWIKLAKISMNTRQVTLPTPDAYGSLSLHCFMYAAESENVLYVRVMASEVVNLHAALHLILKQF